MAAIRHLGCLKEASHTSGDLTNFPPRHRRHRYAPELNLKQSSWQQNFTSGSNLDTRVLAYNLPVCDSRNFSQMTHRPVTVPNHTLTMPSSICLSEWAKCQPWNTQNRGTVLPIVNLMADSELRRPDYCSSYLVTICLSRLVSEIFVCDRQTDKVDHQYSLSAIE